MFGLSGSNVRTLAIPSKFCAWPQYITLYISPPHFVLDCGCCAGSSGCGDGGEGDGLWVAVEVVVIDVLR